MKPSRRQIKSARRMAAFFKRFGSYAKPRRKPMAVANSSRSALGAAQISSHIEQVTA